MIDKYYLLIIGYTFLASLAALLLKKASERQDNVKGLLFFDPYFYMGGMFYFLASIGTIIALKHMSYLLVYFLSALTYVWSVVLGVSILKETITLRKIFAVGFIFIGIILLRWEP